MTLWYSDSVKEYRFTPISPYHISCGGVVYRHRGQELEVLLLIDHDGSFMLPKGTLRHNETLEHCALREIEEESGQRGTITAYLGGRLDEGLDKQTDYPISKITHYFAVAWQEDTGVHDHEYASSRWVTVTQAEQLLTRSSVLAILERFIALMDSDYDFIG